MKHLAEVNGVSCSIKELESRKVTADTPAIRNIIKLWTSSVLIINRIGKQKR